MKLPIKKLLLTASFAATLIPIISTVGCTSSVGNDQISKFSNAEQFKNVLSSNMINLFYGKPSEQEIHDSYDAIKKGSDKGSEFKMTLVANQQHTVSNSGGVKSNNFLIIFSNYQKSFTDGALVNGWHKLSDKWLTDFDDAPKSLLEAWNQPDPEIDVPGYGKVSSTTSLDESHFVDATAILILHHNPQGKQLGEIYNIAKFNNEIFISKIAHQITKFDNGAFDEFAKKIWAIYKQHSDYQIQNVKLWSYLEDLAAKNIWV